MKCTLHENDTLQLESTTAIQDTSFCAAFNKISMRSTTIIYLFREFLNSLDSTVQCIVDIQWFNFYDRFDRPLSFIISILLQSTLLQFHIFLFSNGIQWQPSVCYYATSTGGAVHTLHIRFLNFSLKFTSFL
jgi:hypothetical protein